MNYFDSPKYRIPTTIGNDMTKALLRFMHGSKRKFVDKASWPDNVGCSAKTQPVPTTQPAKTETEGCTSTQPKTERHSLKAE
jgi:hypothetical protein